MNYTLACCFLTHNHCDVVAEILDRCLQSYAAHSIDILICDDSDDDSTKDLTLKLISEGASNLYYIDCHEALNGDHKFLLLMQGKLLPKKYDYIWPSKDRVCFDDIFIDDLCKSIDEGHDVIIGMCEEARWDIGSCVYMKSEYNDPAQFYRLYAVDSTNWEALIRKRSSMLDPIDWDIYSAKYNITDTNNFNQTVSTFARLAEMDSCSIKICRYSGSQRFTSMKAGSLWNDIMFELWIDKWVSANFSLPSLYDDFKSEAIKSETNLAELFGSVEKMIYYRETGVYNSSVYNKYKDVWEYITEIPIPYLEMIAEKNYDGAIEGTLNDFEQSFSDHDYNRGWWLISSNSWLSKFYDDKVFRILIGCFNRYRYEMMHFGKSLVFDGTDSISDIVSKYRNVL